MNMDLLSRIPEWEREADIFEEKARALRSMVENVRVLNGDAARLFSFEVEPVPVGTNQYPTENGPRGRQAVRAIVSERPGRWFVREIKLINRERGWPTDDSGIETAVFRMAKNGEATKIAGRKGYYDFGGETANQVLTTSASQPSEDGA